MASEAGEGAMLVGHSYGGLVAAGAAALLGDLPRLALYEPPMGGVLADLATIDRWERLIRDGERDLMMREFFREVAGYDEAAIDELAGSPLWEARRRVTPTLPRELRAELAHRLDREALGADRSAQRSCSSAARAPSGPFARPRRTPKRSRRAETVTLEGHGHSANVSGPELLAAELRRFYR